MCPYNQCLQRPVTSLFCCERCFGDVAVTVLMSRRFGKGSNVFYSNVEKQPSLHH